MQSDALSNNQVYGVGPRAALDMRSDFSRSYVGADLGDGQIYREERSNGLSPIGKVPLSL